MNEQMNEQMHEWRVDRNRNQWELRVHPTWKGVERGEQLEEEWKQNTENKVQATSTTQTNKQSNAHTQRERDRRKNYKSDGEKDRGS